MHLVPYSSPLHLLGLHIQVLQDLQYVLMQTAIVSLQALGFLQWCKSQALQAHCILLEKWHSECASVESIAVMHAAVKLVTLQVTNALA